jgi:hypothetical protein
MRRRNTSIRLAAAFASSATAQAADGADTDQASQSVSVARTDKAGSRWTRTGGAASPPLTIA